MIPQNIDQKMLQLISTINKLYFKLNLLKLINVIKNIKKINNFILSINILIQINVESFH